MPLFKLVVRGMGRDVAYTYADPVNCRCLYIGGPTEYVKYHRLATERDMTEGELKGNAFLASCPEASMNLRRLLDVGRYEERRLPQVMQRRPDVRHAEQC